MHRPTFALLALSSIACGPEGSVEPATTTATAPSGDWMDTVRGRIAAGEYALRELGDGRLAFANRAHDLRAVLAHDGMQVVPRSGEGWTLGVRTRAVSGYAMDRGPARPGSCFGDQVDERGACLRRTEQVLGSGVVEWWANSPSGLEQGWTLTRGAEGSTTIGIEVDIDGFDVVVTEPTEAVLVNGAVEIAYRGLFAKDTEGRSLDTWLEPTDEGLRVVVDTEGASFPVEVDPLLASPSWQSAGLDCSEIGASLAGVGDMDGDGYDDVAVGVPSFGRGELKEGAVLVFRGGPDGLETTPWWSVQSNKAHAGFGDSVAGAGDVNGDGYPDLVVGAPDWQRPGGGEGMAVLFLGSSTGLSLVPDWVAPTSGAGARLGASVAGAGDVNGDGYDDVIIGAPGFSSVDGVGVALVFEGGPSGPATNPSAVLRGQAQAFGPWFGASVSSAGDVDGDGFDDVLVGAEYVDDGVSIGGSASLFRGSAAGLIEVADWSVTQEGRTTSAFSKNLAGGGDVDGDGYDDVVVGFPALGLGGEAHAFLGSPSGLSTSPDWVVVSDVEDAELGGAVAIVGDADDDGFDDVVIGAPGNEGHVDGRFRFYRGSAGGLEAEPHAEGVGEEHDFSFSVAGAGDVDGDGHDDFLIGAPDEVVDPHTPRCDSSVYLYRGSVDGIDASEPGWTLVSELPEDDLFGPTAAVGDVNGDGYDDLMVSAVDYDPAGAAFLYEGSATGLQTTASWSAEGAEPDARFGAAMAAAGDVDGDGFGDVLIGAPGIPTTSPSAEPYAYLFRGGATGPELTPGWSYADAAAGMLATVVAGAGDVNGDGFDDVAVGAPGYDGALTNQGAVFVFHGGGSGPSSAPDWSAIGGGLDDTFGTSVAGGEDVDGDGFDDLLVGVPGHTDGDLGEGRIDLFRGTGTGLESTPSWSQASDAVGAGLGTEVVMAGDIDGDGFADLAASAPRFDGAADEVGLVWVVPGSATGPQTASARSLVGPRGGARLGHWLSAAGDVNGDGHRDLLVGSLDLDLRHGLFLGAPTGIRMTPGWQSPEEWGLGKTASGAGDVNGDGFSDVVLGGYNAAWLFYGSATGMESEAP